MKTNQLKAIRSELSRGKIVPFQRAVELRAKLEAHSEDNYHAKNPPGKVVAFVNQNANGLQIRKVHPQDAKVPFVWTLFTPRSAWVCGDSVAECFDKALATKADWTNLSTVDANALILAHQAIKDAKNEDTLQVAEVNG